MIDSWLEHAFAYAPWVLFALVVLVAFVMTRGHKVEPARMGQTFACAGCGRRGSRDQMVTASHEGAVMWYCGECAQPLSKPASQSR